MQVARGGEGWSVRTTASKLAAHAIVTRGEELALRGTNDSSYSHPPRLASSSPWLSPLGNRRGPKGVEGACSTVWKPPTIFHDRNLILSDVNQRRERKREREKGNIPELSHKAPLPFQRFFFSLSLSLSLDSFHSRRPFIFSNLHLVGGGIIFTITGR